MDIKMQQDVIQSIIPDLEGKQAITDQERFLEWQKKYTKSNPSYKFIARQENEHKPTNIYTDTENNLENLKTKRATTCAVTGSANDDFSKKLLEQTIAGCFSRDTDDVTNTMNANVGAMLSLSPQDEIEGMLISRLLVLHNQSMTFLERSSDSKASTIGIDNNINRSVKLMRVFNETLQALTKYKRKAEQTMIVQHQHVNVGNGAQAAFGTFSVGGKDNDKNGG